MELSNELISQFAKLATGDKQEPKESTVYGKVKIRDGKRYVQLDGSELFTPIPADSDQLSSTTHMEDGDRVTVTIKNHTLTVTGNTSVPSNTVKDSTTGEIVPTSGKISDFEIIVADMVTTDYLDTKFADIDTLISDAASIKNLEAYIIETNELITEEVTARKAAIEELEASQLKVEDLDAKYATIESLRATDAAIEELEAGQIKVEDLDAKYATIENLDSTNATIENLDTKYANIDFSNIGEAAVEKIFSESGIIEDLIVSEGKITGELVGVTIKGDLIEGNTIKAEKLVVKGSDGIYYKLNVAAEATTSEEVTEEELQNGLHGTAIIAKTITAEKIAVDDLVAFGATIGGFKINNSAIYSGIKESATNPIRGVYLDNDGQLAVGDSENFLRYYKDEDGNYKLEISASSLVFSASGKNVEEVIEDNMNLEIGARNLVRNSTDLVFEGYNFVEGTVTVSYDEGNVNVESNAIVANVDDSGNAELYTSLLTAEDDGIGNVALYADSDEGVSEETIEMKTLTIGGITFEVVDEEARARIGNLDDLMTEDKSSLVAALNEVYVTGGIGTGGGGGGSSANNAVLSLTNTSGWLSKSVAIGSDCYISLTWSSLENGLSTGNGVMTIHVNNILKTTREVTQGDMDINVGEYISAGSNSIRVRVTDIYGNVRTLSFTIAGVSLSITSTFDAGTVYRDSILYTYTPYGNVAKNVEFWLDGEQIGTDTVNTSGREVKFTIPKQEHGSHTFEVFCTATIDGNTVPSNHLYYDLICAVDGDTTPIITSSYRAGNVEQYDTVQIKYRVYDPTNLSTTITQTVNDGTPKPLTVNRIEQTWSYYVEEVGTVTLKIKCGNTTKTFVLNATESDIQVNAETEFLSLYLTSYGRSNGEDHPEVWTFGDISANLTNFNFVSDGWQLDSDGVTVLRIAGDARVTIPYQIFASDFRTSGKTIEIEFATRDVLNYDAVLFSCMSGGRGLELTTQRAILTSEQSSIGTQYKEEEHVRLSFVVEKRANNHLLLCYINGILSGSVQYPDKDDFSQGVPVDISIGHNDCITDIYNIRVYDNDLTRYQILDNWIADTRIASLMKDRYTRNNIYDEYGQITVETNKADLPYLVIESAVSPQFKGDKKTCSGYYIDPNDTTKSFIFNNAVVDVQGTSSQYYYVKNYKIKFDGGFTLTNGTVLTKYQMNENSVPTDIFTFKADVASSEGANNVILAELYNELCPVLTPPQETNPKVRQTIEGHPIVIFWDYGDGPVFVGKYNFNNDKGTEEVFGFSTGDESWEILQNGTDRVGFHSADFSDDSWKNDFEARYPEDNTDVRNLKEFAEWLVSVDQTQATGATLSSPVTYEGVDYTTDTAEYRVAKFKMELPDHADVSALVFYYVFTEIFLCIDQREKNAFPTLWAQNPRWMMLFYDADSSLGIDNKGNLTFDYYLEDIDYTEAGDPVYNGQNSVLWVNLRDAFYDKIVEEYQRLRTTIRTDGSDAPLISYDVVNNLFEAHQTKWCEAIYNEDGYKKSIEPLALKSDAFYLPMLQGKKEQQRKWWLYNRFRYLDSKYVTGSSMKTRIVIRAHAKANVKLIAYVNMYGHVYYNAEMVEHRMYRGEEYEFVWAASGAEDPVIGINDADMLTSIGDLSPLMVETVDISKATHLTSLKVGDASTSYINRNLNSITLGNNVLLRSIDLRNCVSLTQSVDASGCIGLEEAYFDGTAITGLSLPNGGGLKTLHLPGTIKNLTLRNQAALTDFVIPSYTNITTLWLENNSNVIDPLAILSQMAENSRVRIIGFELAVESADEIFDFYDSLDLMRGLDENGLETTNPQMSGAIYIDALTGSELAEMQSRYPTIAIAYSHITSYLYYYTYDGSELLRIEEIVDGGDGVYTGTPTRDNTAQYAYTFAGWSLTPNGSANQNALLNVTADRSVYAAYSATVRTYTVTWKNGSTTLETDTNVPYGTVPTYNGSDPVYSGDDADDYEWNGWTPAVGAIVGDTTYTAQFKYNGYVYTKLIDRGLSGAYTNDSVTSIGDYAFYNCKSLTSVDFPAATSIGIYAFQDCSALTSADFPVATSIGMYAFLRCSSLTTADFPAATTIGDYAFRYCSALTSVDFPAATSVGNYTFEYCSALTSADFPVATSIGMYAFLRCSSLTTADFPVATSIYAYAFQYCYRLTALILRSETMCTLYNTNAFDRCYHILGTTDSTYNPTGAKDGYIYVPSALVAEYQAATNWSTYADQIRAIEDYPDICGGESV